MAFYMYVYLLVVFLILCLALLWHLCWFPRRPSSSSGRPSAARCTVCSSRAPHVIVRPVAFPPASQQVLVHRQGRCGPGAR